eukprot:TRINITY_DN87392_c0_g2_i1.p1 TRINITY_DN87392_c0_g2~~TRINITY_DN87392_c0_g2_i1.p1  ORF type:complete len:167 (-),score=19.70 TRINITY_DN87392_c0_g2_i1:10-510(-)
MTMTREKEVKEPEKVPVLKDNDFRKQVRLHPEVARQMIQQLAADSEFLRTQGIMDYSLLLGIHNCSDRRLPGQRHCSGLDEEPVTPMTPMSPTSSSGSFLSPSTPAQLTSIPPPTLLVTPPDTPGKTPSAYELKDLVTDRILSRSIEIGRAVQQECRDRSRMPSSA